MMKAVIIINGENVHVELDADEPLGVWRDKALIQSNNTGRPLEEWEIRNEQGRLLSVWETLFDLELTNYPRIFVSLRVGAGGGDSCVSRRAA